MMNLQGWIFSGLLVGSSAVAMPDLIPKPAMMKEISSDFKLTANVTIGFSGCETEATFLADTLAPLLGKRPSVTKSANAGIVLIVDDSLSDLEEEGYQLKIDAQGIRIVAKDAAGIFYGIQSIRQMLPVESFGEKSLGGDYTLEGVEIEDKPVYPWRGMMLDTSRYFYDTDYVKKYIDMMAMHKMNVLHLHLIDDPGWRLEIKKYPKLTEVGAYRGKGNDRYGGFYTQDEMRDIVKYAADRHIEIIPEIELPAHVQSAIASYPHLGCTGQQFEVPTTCYISRELYCAGKESTYEFLEDVMKEVMDIFPAKFIHIGGDEAKYDRWKACPDCQAKKKEQGLENYHQLQGYMTRRMEKFLMAHGRRLIGWDEILDGGLEPNATVMTWHRYHTAIEAAKNGNNVVMALTGHAYFDAPESRLAGEPPAATWIAPISLQRSYEWEPAPTELNAEQKKRVLGAHGCLWTDRLMHNPILTDLPALNEVRSMNYVDYLTLPRMAALSEVVWTPQADRDYADFEARMKTHYNRYSAAGYMFRVPLPLVEKPVEVDGGYKITAKVPVEGAVIRYTTDGQKPMAESPILDGEVIVDNPEDFRAVTFVNRRHHSLTFAYPEDKLKKFTKLYGPVTGEWKAGKVPGKTFGMVDFDATGKIDSNGDYEVTFMYTSGECRLEIQKVEVVVNDRVVAVDEHFGFTGGSSKDNVYKLKVNDYETGQNFYLRATIRGDLNSNSNGYVFIRKK